MRILWLSHMLPYPPSGGSLLRTYHLLREVSRFARVDVLAFVQRGLIPPGTTVEQSVAELSRFVRILGVHDIPSDTPIRKAALALRCALSGTSYTTRWTYSPGYARAVAHHLLDSYDALVLDTIGLAKNVPEGDLPAIVLNHHNEEVSMLLRRAERCGRGFRSAYFRAEAKRLQEACERFFPRVDHHLVCSELDIERLCAIRRDARVTTIPNGVDTAEYGVVYDPDGAGPFDMLFIGGAGWYPNRDAIGWLLDEIWPACRERIPDARLVLVGRAPTPQALAAAQRDDRVVVTGFVEDIRPYAARARAFVCPMRDGGGTRLKILHAMSLGLPVISTSLGVEGIDATAGEHYLLAERTEEFVTQLERIARSPREGASISAAGRRLVEDRYDWGKIGRTLESCFASQLTRLRS